jgi:hypothetical protein
VAHGAAYNGLMLLSPVGAAIVGLAVLMAQAPPAPAPRPQAPRTTAAVQPLFPEVAAPTEATLGVTLYPSAQFLTSYDAGRGQRFYLFGSTAGFNELVAYYRTLLKQKGTAVFENPPTYIFEVGRYDENAMAFPPSVTIKDYTAGGNGGFLNPKPGGTPERFPTVIQIVPMQSGV